MAQDERGGRTCGWEMGRELLRKQALALPSAVSVTARCSAGTWQGALLLGGKWDKKHHQEGTELEGQAEGHSRALGGNSRN